MFKKILLIFTALFLNFFVISITPVLAAPTSIMDLLGGQKTIFDYGKEFCDKRSGNLMNLETWFSGKCAAGTDTLSGDGVGFSDIVWLQMVENLIGPQYKSFPEKMTEFFTNMTSLRNKIESGTTINQIPEAHKLSDSPLSKLILITSDIFLTKPAQTKDYLAFITKNLKNKNIIKNAYAAEQGYGFSSLAPILPLWAAFRNISYMLFAFVFIVFGFMIMLRVKIDAKTILTVELAIPKIVITLLLITFSYAIVGLLVDISTLLTYVMMNLLVTGGILAGNMTGDIGQNPFTWGVSGLTWAGGIGSWIINSFVAQFVSPFILLNLMVGGWAGVIIGGFSGFILLPFIFVAIFIGVGYAYMRLIWNLFQAYISIIVNLIFAPVILLGNIFPGSNAVGNWFRNLVGNLAAFPVSVFFLVLSYALMIQPVIAMFTWWPNLFKIGSNTTTEWLFGVKQLASGNTMWAPPLTTPSPDYGFEIPIVGNGGNLAPFMLATIGLGILFMANRYVDMVKDAIKVPAFPYGSAIGQNLNFGGQQVANPHSRFNQFTGGYFRGISDTWTQVLTGGNVNPATGQPSGGRISMDDIRRVLNALGRQSP